MCTSIKILTQQKTGNVTMLASYGIVQVPTIHIAYIFRVYLIIEKLKVGNYNVLNLSLIVNHCIQKSITVYQTLFLNIFYNTNYELIFVKNILHNIYYIRIYLILYNYISNIILLFLINYK